MIRVRVFEDLKLGLMVTGYVAARPVERGFVSYVPIEPVKPRRPGGSFIR